MLSSQENVRLTSMIFVTTIIFNFPSSIESFYVSKKNKSKTDQSITFNVFFFSLPSIAIAGTYYQVNPSSLSRGIWIK